jgi:hypothetical protein
MKTPLFGNKVEETMRRRGCSKGLGMILMLVAVLWLYGCGSGTGPVDELGWRYAIIDPIVVNDGDTERHEIDLTTTDEATITVTPKSNTDEPYDLFIHKMVWVFHLDGTSDAGLALQITTQVNDKDELGGNFIIQKNGGGLTITKTFFTAAYKQFYLAAIGGTTVAETFWAGYTVDFTLYGSFSQDSDDNDVTIKGSTWFTIIQPTDTTTTTTTP